ncbi:hypothetical protein BB561_005529 [Smittium simulii]|uniref:Uncharacterized protein n=1 Tax=Smittium simulii TaxID=133385 RepID=A0A2T9Y9W7_9FUNG|nr:hypothetical protein BB561_005529 [Smittium simulii]
MELSEKNPKLNKEQDNLLLNTEEFDTVVKANSKTKKKVYSDKKTPLSAPTGCKKESAYFPGEHQYSSTKAQRTRISDQELQNISCHETDNQLKKIVGTKEQSLDKNLELELTGINIWHRITEPDLNGLSFIHEAPELEVFNIASSSIDISLYINEKKTLSISKALCLTSAIFHKKFDYADSKQAPNLQIMYASYITQSCRCKITCYSWYKKSNTIDLSTVVKLGILERTVFFFTMESDSTSNIENPQKKTNTNTNNVPVDIRNMISRFDKIDDQKINIVTRNNNNFRPKCGKSPLSDKNKWCLTIWRLSGVFSKTNVTLKSQLKLWFLINDLLNVKKKIQQSNKNL